jgi:hypothetical protein
MSTLIDIISLLAILANVFFALHIWSGMAERAQRQVRGR